MITLLVLKAEKGITVKGEQSFRITVSFPENGSRMYEVEIPEELYDELQGRPGLVWSGYTAKG